MSTQAQIQHLDFRPEIRCEFPHCNNLATHQVQMSCLDSDFAGCGVHTARIGLEAQLELARKPRGVCPKCGQRPTVEVKQL